MRAWLTASFTRVWLIWSCMDSAIFETASPALCIAAPVRWACSPAICSAFGPPGTASFASGAVVWPVVKFE